MIVFFKWFPYQLFSYLNHFSCLDKNAFSVGFPIFFKGQVSHKILFFIFPFYFSVDILWTIFYVFFLILFTDNNFSTRIMFGSETNLCSPHFSWLTVSLWINNSVHHQTPRIPSSILWTKLFIVLRWNRWLKMGCTLPTIKTLRREVTTQHFFSILLHNSNLLMMFWSTVKFVCESGRTLEAIWTVKG